jgi:hypothetical protein
MTTQQIVHVRSVHVSEDVPRGWWDGFHSSMLRSHWQPPTWDRTCPHCNARLMKGERNEWCCSGGKSVVPPLPPLPANMVVMLQDHGLSKDISALSRRLNNLFSFTAIGATGGFTQFATGPPSVSITGRTYHRLYDVTDARHSLHWYLYDKLERDECACHFDVPWQWIQGVKMDLERVNPYIGHLHRFNDVDDAEPRAIELTDISTNGDFAAIMHASNTTDVRP